MLLKSPYFAGFFCFFAPSAYHAEKLRALAPTGLQVDFVSV
ncbi:hypothetical protein LMG28614_02549 [Paraburkholderia ultramafica]|uniref:Uncharacterized protein n=1 Tax=Paraburkholderia ultramafica TaxID=1544867 RepID=A0A6S7B4P5_9BURK|nr:hypothetical protein LMG28614_02549 [Paraburkholderia ultramafica]